MSSNRHANSCTTIFNTETCSLTPPLWLTHTCTTVPTETRRPRQPRHDHHHHVSCPSFGHPPQNVGHGIRQRPNPFFDADDDSVPVEFNRQLSLDFGTRFFRFLHRQLPFIGLLLWVTRKDSMLIACPESKLSLISDGVRKMVDRFSPFCLSRLKKFTHRYHRLEPTKASSLFAKSSAAITVPEFAWEQRCLGPRNGLLLLPGSHDLSSRLLTKENF
ncbi:hypothetical protein BC830DRAFT_167023 [Chytriomyces sp. MP71]|nr:hypothetical protein BC830DRAFT_167023 [Chytriomyces sp. MP71]